MAATAGAFSLVTANPGWTATARSMNRRTAAYWPSATGSTIARLAAEAQPLEAAQLARVGRGRQARDRVLLLARDVQHGPARDDDLDVRRGAEQVGDDRGRGDDLLEVVEHEQQPLVAQPVGERARRSGGPALRRRRPRPRSAARRASARGSARAATKKTPSGKSSAARAASWSDSRVLPVPPGPVRVSSRVVASRPAASSSSASRPTNVVSCVGRLFGRASSVRSGGNSTGSPSATTWKMRTGAPRSLSRCSPRSRSVTPSIGRRRSAGRGSGPRRGSGRRGRRPRSAPPG